MFMKELNDFDKIANEMLKSYMYICWSPFMGVLLFQGCVQLNNLTTAH